MPLTPLQHRILSIIARHRDPESFIGRGTVLQRSGIRRSRDIDVFHDREERLNEAAATDIRALRDAGFEVRLALESATFVRAVITDGGEPTKLEWVLDSDFRFFPPVPDPEFGFVRHPLDLATNKIAAAASRLEVRDAIDLLWIHDHIQPLGAVAWAAVEKSPGWMPDGLLMDVRWRSRYQDYHLAGEDLLVPLTAAELNNRLRALLDTAERLVGMMPRTLEYGALLNPDGSLAQPDPDRPESLEGLVVHHGSRKGAWPSSPEISSLMLRRGHPEDR
jgi:hypothetical protein